MNPSRRIGVRHYERTDQRAWDQYVQNHSHATLYHLSGWKNVIEKTYGHNTYYLIAANSSKLKAQRRISPLPISYQLSAMSHELNIVGILPLVHLKHFLFGNSLISMPFFDMGGILADDEETEKAFLTEAIQLGQKLKVKIIELRHIQSLSCLRELNPPNSTNLQPVKFTPVTAERI